MSTPKAVLSTLAGASGDITLAMNVAGVLIPLVKGVIKSIESIGAKQETVTYEVLLQTDGAALDAIDALAAADLAAINAELVRLGLQPVPVAPPDAPAAS
jgi:hypothetical protein